MDRADAHGSLGVNAHAFEDDEDAKRGKQDSSNRQKSHTGWLAFGVFLIRGALLLRLLSDPLV